LIDVQDDKCRVGPQLGSVRTSIVVFENESLETPLLNHDFPTRILGQVSHRPWPIPNAPWLMTQTWHQLLFAHWTIDPSELRSKVPSCFELDLFDGAAWVGVVPFHMSNVAPRGVPSLPWVSRFPELNVRTYVRVGQRPGVYFFSLDAASRVAVKTARALLNLPYQHASMTVHQTVGEIHYDSVRTGTAPAEFKGIYKPVGPPFVPVEGSLEYFLTERYCLYHLDRGGLPYRLEIHHPPWMLQPAEARLARNTMAEASGIALRGQPSLVHFVERQDAVAWAPKRI